MTQDYQSMVKLVEDLENLPNIKINEALGIQQLYAFALNRYCVVSFCRTVQDQCFDQGGLDICICCVVICSMKLCSCTVKAV